MQLRRPYPQECWDGSRHTYYYSYSFLPEKWEKFADDVTFYLTCRALTASHSASSFAFPPRNLDVASSFMRLNLIRPQCNPVVLEIHLAILDP